MNKYKQNKLAFRTEECIESGSPYKIIDCLGRKKKGKDGYCRPINRGAAGVVYRALYKDMERAIKILHPREDSKQRDLFPEFERTFEEEILKLSKLTHTHLSKLLDYGKFRRGNRNYHYYVMEYIDGVQFDKILATNELNTESFLRLCDQILSALQYLHSKSVLHSDIKEANILVKKEDNAYGATLVDLGVSKTIEETSLLKPGSSLYTYFYSTKKYTRPEYQSYMGRKVKRGQIRGMFPDHDLYSFGCVLKNALSTVPLQDRLKKDLSIQGFEAIEKIRDRLLGPISQQFPSAAVLREAFRKLNPEYLSPLGIPEMSISINVKKSIALPNDRVRLTERFYAIINNPVFQRLRNLTQLNFAYLLYPGAKHSRFLHSLSTFNLAREYLAHLLDDPSFRLLVDPEDMEATLLWALLHDIGHYPLSHMFEDFSEEERVTTGQSNVLIDESLFRCFVFPVEKIQEVKNFKIDKIITLKFSEIITNICESSINSKESIVSILNKKFSEKTRNALFDLTLGSEKNIKHLVLRAVLSCPIDVDKVSYLLMDSAMTGVQYGMGIDLDALLSSLCMPKEGISARRGEMTPVLAISDKGLPAAESVTLARYWMLRRVYWHHTNRSIMSMIKFVISAMLSLGKFRFDEYFRDTFFLTDIEALRYIGAKYENILRQLEEKCGRKVGNPLIGILGGQREVYKRLVTVSKGPDEIDVMIHQRLCFRRRNEIEDIREQIIKAIERNIGKDKIATSDVLLDIPMRPREELGGKLLVYLAKDPNKGLDFVANVSPLVSQLRNEFDFHVKKCRVFISPALFDKIESMDKLDAIRSEVRERLVTILGIEK